MADSTCINCGVPLQLRERHMCQHCCNEYEKDDSYEFSGVIPLDPRKAPK